MQITIEATDQPLYVLNKIGIDHLEPIRMLGDVPHQEAQKLAKHRIVYFHGRVRVSTTSPSGRIE